jgi:hypothetical protein
MSRIITPPGADAPPGVLGVGERVRAEVAFRLHRLLDSGDGIGEELIQERRVPQPQPVTTMTGITISFLARIIEAASEPVSSCQR